MAYAARDTADGRASHATRAPHAARRETESQRRNRNFTELLQELRVAQTGVQILFGFLLTVPFNNRFARVTAVQLGVYIATLMACAVTAALLIAPVSHHRRLFRQGRKAEVLARADRFARAGLLSLMCTVTGAVFLVMDVLLGIGAAAPLAAFIACIYYLLWYRPLGAPERTRPENGNDEGA